MSHSSSPVGAIASPAAGRVLAGVPEFTGRPRRWVRIAAPALRASAAVWFAAAALGQLLFALYVAVFYGRAVAQGQPETWNQVLQRGYVPGDRVGNVVLAAHLLFAVVVTAGGVLQLLPRLRTRWPRFHRWNGRIYVASGAVAGVGGLFLLWTRPQGGDLTQHLGISLDGVLILLFAALAWWHARRRRFDAHRRWALRLFLAMNAVWFFRIGLMLWLVLNQGPVGFDPQTFTGPFLSFLAFAQYLLPLAVLELYFRAQSSRDPRLQLAMAAVLLLATLATIVGSGAAAAVMWLPKL